MHGANSEVTLKGTGKDPDGDTLTFSWEQVSGPIVQLKHADSPRTSFNVSSLGEDKILRFALTVIDGRGGEDTDSTKVILKGNDSVEKSAEAKSLRGARGD